MNSLPYMQLYVNDYLADTAHLNAVQHGGYILLLMNYWQQGKPLNNSREKLAAVARMTPDEWEDNREVLAEFFWIDGDMWTHARVENDLAKVREKSEKASTSARQAFAKRSQSDRIANGEQSPIYTDTDTDTDTKKNIYPEAFERFWEIYPLRVGKGSAMKAWAKAIKKTTPEIIYEGAERYGKDPNRDQAFTAHPATWLNGDRWLDSPLPQKRAQGGFREMNTTPTVVPPRFTTEDRLEGAPMPDSVKALLGQIRRNP
jgi:uncharacterized protein YdaU (DUF1376 family)